LKKAEIIPTVINAFVPKLAISVFWENATAEVGNTIDPSRTQDAPHVQFIAHVPDAQHEGSGLLKAGVQLTVALTDPDAPSRDNPEWSEICHWVATDVQLAKPSIDHHGSDGTSLSGSSKDVKTIMEYKPPGPPPKTGKHRYVFVALAPKNGTTEKLDLSTPGDRQHWGYGKERVGLRRWAEENGLVVVGASFVYEQNEEQ